MIYLFLIAMAVAAAVGFYFIYTRRKITPTAAGSSGWFWLNSPGMGAVTHEGGWNVFSFPSGGQAHMLVRNTGPLSGKVMLKWQFAGEARPVQGKVATVSLIVIRRGNTWKQAEYRWYWAGLPIAGGPIEVEVTFDPSHWVNVYGKKAQGNDNPAEDNPGGFAAALAEAEYVGLAFGDPAAGATAHGVSGTGKFSFTFDIAP